MIAYKPRKWKEYKGDYQVEVAEVTVENNGMYDPSREDSTEEVLTIVFNINDPGTGEVTQFTQKFVNPVTGGGLFQDLLDILGELPDKDGGEHDEQKFVGVKGIASFGKRANKEKNKEYDTIMKIVPLADDKQPPQSEGLTPPVGKDEKVDEDLPFS